MKTIWTFALLHFFYRTTSARSVSLYIAGGHSAPIEQFPYLVSLWREEKLICGGALLSDACVLTAAHCVEDERSGTHSNFTQLKPDYIKAGATHINDAGVRANVKIIFVSDSYSPKTNHMDAAILKLSKPLEGYNIQPLPLCKTGSPKAGQEVVISGWGVTNIPGKTKIEDLQTARVIVDDKDECRHTYSHINEITDAMFCASYNGEKDSCAGDSGGPVVLPEEQCNTGIISWGVGCATMHFPSVYTDIASAEVQQFLNPTIKKHCL